MTTYHDILRMLVVHDLDLMAAIQVAEGAPRPADPLDARSRSIARVAALVAHDGAVETFDWTIGDALDAGVSADEIVGILLAVAPLVGVARIVSSAPKVGLALGYDLDAALEVPDGPP